MVSLPFRCFCKAERTFCMNAAAMVMGIQSSIYRTFARPGRAIALSGHLYGVKDDLFTR